jgi:hypothetical protein
MARWQRPVGPNDQVIVPTGDTAFVGMDLKTQDPAQMLTGWYQEAYNVRLENGGMATRKGCLCPVCYNSATFGQIYGVGIYSDPNGSEWMALATANGVWFLLDGGVPQFIPMTSVINYPVEFSQAFNNFYMWRGNTMPPLRWQGDWSVYWQSLPDPSQGSPPDTTRIPMPSATTAETFNSRMLVPHDRDSLAISDIGEDHYQWAVNDFRVNFGEADTLVRVFPWVQDTVICFKTHSIYQLANVTGDLSATTLQRLPGKLGLVGMKAVVEIAGDIMFLDSSGVYKISQIFEGSPQASALPISDSIKPLIDSINWNAVDGIRATSRRERVYFAVPLRNATRNNALIVYNLISTSWESVDTFGDPDFRFDDLVKTNYIGERRIFAIDRQKGVVVLLEQGRTDLLGSDISREFQIQFAVLTRGYAGVGPQNSFPRVGIDLSTWNPNFSVEAFTDGSNEKKLITNRTKSRTTYETFGKRAWNQANLQDDHATARRKDYSVGFQTGYPPGLPADQQGFMLGNNGIQVEREQQGTERFDINMRGRFCQLRIENTVGSIGIRSVVLEDYEDSREPRHHT